VVLASGAIYTYIQTKISSLRLPSTADRPLQSIVITPTKIIRCYEDIIQKREICKETPRHEEHRIRDHIGCSVSKHTAVDRLTPIQHPEESAHKGTERTKRQTDKDTRRIIARYSYTYLTSAFSSY